MKTAIKNSGGPAWQGGGGGSARHYAKDEAVVVYGVECPSVGVAGEPWSEDELAMRATPGAYKARYILEIGQVRVDGRGSANLAHLVNCGYVPHTTAAKRHCKSLCGHTLQILM